VDGRRLRRRKVQSRPLRHSGREQCSFQGSSAMVTAPDSRLPGSMRALTLRAPGQPLVLDTLPVPTPTANDVLVKVLACGVCRTDLHILDGGARAPSTARRCWCPDRSLGAHPKKKPHAVLRGAWIWRSGREHPTSPKNPYNSTTYSNSSSEKCLVNGPSIWRVEWITMVAQNYSRSRYPIHSACEL
jgi:hypothetical protein